MSRITTWRRELNQALNNKDDTWADVVALTLSDEELDAEFYPGYGSTEGTPFTLWTHNRVYFPWAYDGLEGVASVPRNPCDEKTKHVEGI